MKPEYSLGINLIFHNNPVDPSIECSPENLGGILQKRLPTQDPGGPDVSNFHSEYNHLPPNSNPYDVAKLVNEIINGHLINGEYGAIETFLQGLSTDPWRKLQLTEYQRIQGNYVDAKLNLNALLSDGDVQQELKDVAIIYLIRNKLEETEKTWFDISETNLSTISSFAMADGELPATLIARNILELIRGFSVDVRIDDFDYQISNPNDTSALIEPEFTIYPNPIVGVLNINYNLQIDVPFRVDIYELLRDGLVHSGEMTGSPFVLDVSSWQTGFYSILITDSNGEILFRSRTHIKNK
jgi:hypothetical protein